jgi:hypothetical protein
MPNNHILLQRITLTVSASSVTFSNIPQAGYTDLKIVVSARTDSSNVSGYGDGLIYYYNGLTTNLSTKRIYGQGNGPVGSTGGSIQYGGMISTAGQTANTFGSSEIYVPNYNSSFSKSSIAEGISENNTTTNQMQMATNLWSSTAAITSITFAQESGGTNFAVGSSFSIYGIANLTTTPTLSPKALGGDIITTNGTYWFHAFTSTGSFTPMTDLSCDYLVVGGGGGGTYGGGGAGGLKSNFGNGGGGSYLYSALSLNRNQSYTATVGAGGSAGTNTSSSGASNGTTSSFSIWSGSGGGRGGIFVAPVSESGQSGGSGGGGGGADTGNTPGLGGGGIIGHGYAGGSGVAINTTNGGGGGGGAMAVGENAIASSFGGQGGIGKSLLGFATATGTGNAGYYAGGGSGGGSSSRAGGFGGGGAGGAANTAGSSGIKNTGGGGGGGGNTSGGLAGGAGASGIVIISYPV